jgi:hypothetical protein
MSKRTQARGADAKVTFAGALLSITLCSCAVHHDAYIHQNLVGPTVTGNDQQVTVAHVRNEMDGQRLLKRTASNLGRARSSIEWKVPEQFTTAKRARVA